MQQLDNKIKTEQLDNKIQTEHLKILTYYTNV